VADIAHFWQGFGDATLSGLIATALAANGDLQLAQARLQEARANQGFAEADQLPALSANADASRAITPRYQLPGATRSQRTYSAYDASFVASWELDLFGRASSARAAATALVQAGEAGVDGARVSISAEVARNYLQLRGTQERRAVTAAALVNQRESLAIVQARYDAGRATELDLRRAQTLVESTEAQLPALDTAIDQLILRLATLSGEAPRTLVARLGAPAALPGLPVTDLATLPLGTPEQWLARRPDLRSAERQVAAAYANIAVSRAELYPHISLSGLLGLSAGTLGALGESQSVRYAVGPTISWSAFDFGRVRSRIGAAEARQQQALVNWQQSVRLALEETEGALSQFGRGTQRTQQLSLAADHAASSAKLARLRYEAGVTDFLAVLDAERDALSTRDQLVQSRTDNATALVAVYRTLGGGWEISAAGTAGSP
jgi:multidrug efflux system outer membrane protein